MAPVLFKRHELRTDSGGAGEHRGGLGQTIELQATEDDILLFLSVERIRFAVTFFSLSSIQLKIFQQIFVSLRWFLFAKNLQRDYQL